MSLPACVLWIDPGGMTGLAALWRHDGQHRFTAAEFGFHEACSNISEACSAYGSGLAVGWERTMITPRSPQDIAVAFEVTGVARWQAGQHGCQVLPPAERHTPDEADRKRLTAIGWWRPGEKDSQSAACHLLRWLMRSGNLPSDLGVTLAVARQTGR